MKLFRRTARRTSDPRLDERLHDIFEDRRTPGAPEALYEFLREVPVNSAERGRGRFGIAWHGLGRTGRAAASLAVVVVLVAGVAAVTVGLPRGTDGGLGSSPSAVPTTFIPRPPAGWSFQIEFGSGGHDSTWVGTSFLEPAPRIGVHVWCTGPDEVIVLVSTVPGMGLPEDRPAQSALFKCDTSGRESRVELTAASGAFQQASAVIVRSPAALVDTSFTVSIEVPAATPSPSASS